MPQLEPDKYAEIAQKIDELEPEIDKLYASAKNFITDQVERKKQYGERMFLSPKQITWIENLHDEFVGTAEPADTRDELDKHVFDGPRNGDMDDDISF